MASPFRPNSSASAEPSTMSAMTTFAPSSTNRRAIELPISPAPPVTITALSLAEIGIYAPPFTLRHPIHRARPWLRRLLCQAEPDSQDRPATAPGRRAGRRELLGVPEPVPYVQAGKADPGDRRIPAKSSRRSDGALFPAASRRRYRLAHGPQ